MSNEEKARKIVDNIFSTGANTHVSFYEIAYDSAIRMAEWKEHQFSEEKKQLIKRAGDWWELMLHQGSPDLQRGIELMIEQFKKEMMEE